MKSGNHFKPAWWLPGPHLQTLFPHIFRNRRPPRLRRERVELDDGDFLDLDWTAERSGPLVLLLHGLEGSIRSHYVAGLMHSLGRCGLQTVLLNFRGCSGEPNRLPRSYHSGETGDLDFILARFTRTLPERPLYCVGVSLGGNVLLKWLGEYPDQQHLQKAVAVSVPFELNKSARRLERGLSSLYQRHLLRRLRSSTRAKAGRTPLPFDPAILDELQSFRSFDDRVTAPLHGFDGVDDYYRRSSSRRYIRYIRTPTLLIHSHDDPFMTPDAIPVPDELGPGVRLELSTGGGHVGFVSGNWPGVPRFWLDQRICEFFSIG